MEEAKDELMAMERVLLQTIKFDFNVEHAHKYIIQVKKVFHFLNYLCLDSIARSYVPTYKRILMMKK